MIRLILMRHGEAEIEASSDRARQLTSRGIEEVRRSVTELQSLSSDIDKLIVSPFTRARQTADIVQAAYGGIPEVISDRVTPAQSPDVVLAVIEEHLVGVDTGLIVFHQPIAGRLVHFLTGDHVAMRTAGVAVIEISIPGREMGELKCVI